jgi:hypothetical protein
MVLTVSFVLSPVTGLFATVAGEISFTNLTPASGREQRDGCGGKWRSFHLACSAALVDVM